MVFAASPGVAVTRSPYLPYLMSVPLRPRNLPSTAKVRFSAAVPHGVKLPEVALCHSVLLLRDAFSGLRSPIMLLMKARNCGSYMSPVMRQQISPVSGICPYRS
jgi:hypothetical protein